MKANLIKKISIKRSPLLVLPTIIVVVTLLSLGLHMSAYKVDIVSGVRFVGHADEAAYAEMGRSLVKGRGFNIRHISVFFIPYSQEIERREDHWPPLMGMAIAPAFLAWGIESWAAKMPAVLFGSAGLPVATGLLGMVFSGKAYVGLVCGLMMMANIHIFTESLKTLSDVALAMLMAFFLAAAIGARKRPWLHVVAGIVMAMAYYAKGSMIVFFPLYPVIALLTCGKKVFSKKWIYAGLTAGTLCIMPWLVTNWVHYGDPFHSTQNFVSGYIGFGSWESNFYHPHWGENLPQTSDRWTKHGDRYWDVTRRNAEAFTRYALLGTRAGEQEWYRFGRPGALIHQWLAPKTSSVRRNRAEMENYGAQWGPVSEWSAPISAFSGIGTVVFIAVFLITVPLLAIKIFFSEIMGLLAGRKFSETGTGEKDDEKPHDPFALLFTRAGPVMAILLVMAVNWAFIVFLWEIRARFAFVFLPATAVLAVTGAARVLESIPASATRLATNSPGGEFFQSFFNRDKWRRWRWLPVLMLCTATFVGIMQNTDRLKDYHRDNVNTNRFPYRDRSIYPALGDWLHLNKPDAAIMSRNPWQLRFHSPDSIKTVGLPYAPPEQILGIGRYYGITHYLNDRNRSGMGRYVGRREPHPAFEPVEGAPGNLYRILWDELKHGEDYIEPAAENPFIVSLSTLRSCAVRPLLPARLISP